MLTLQADDLIMALEGNNYGLRHFLDRQTGEILFISDEQEIEDDREQIDEIITPISTSNGFAFANKPSSRSSKSG